MRGEHDIANSLWLDGELSASGFLTLRIAIEEFLRRDNNQSFNQLLEER
jgi:hypothetical protein